MFKIKLNPVNNKLEIYQNKDKKLQNNMHQVWNKKNFLVILKNYLNVNFKLEVNHKL
jgi:hypothetical protein